MDLPYEIIGMICEFLWKPWRARDFASMLIVSKITNFACRHSAAFIEFTRVTTCAIVCKEVRKYNMSIDQTFHLITKPRLKPRKYTQSSYYIRGGSTIWYEQGITCSDATDRLYKGLSIYKSDSRTITITPTIDSIYIGYWHEPSHLLDYLHDRVREGFTTEYLREHGYLGGIVSVISKIRDAKDMYNMMLVGKYAYYECKRSARYIISRARKWRSIHQELRAVTMIKR